MLIIYNKSTIVDSLRSRVWPSDEKRQDFIVNNIHDEQFLKICLSSNDSQVFPTSCVGYYEGRPIESEFHRLIITNYNISRRWWMRICSSVAHEGIQDSGLVRAW